MKFECEISEQEFALIVELITPLVELIQSAAQREIARYEAQMAKATAEYNNTNSKELNS